MNTTTKPTIEDLLKPRVRVILDYPGSPFANGDILIQDLRTLKEVWIRVQEFENIRSDRAWISHEYVRLYPEIFKPVQWWEGREPEELPKYVKNAADKIVFRVEYNFDGHTPSDVKTWNVEAPAFWHSLYDLLPSTKEEYDQHTSQP
jgi:hypothetical protein